jgi:hypothetical protein
MSKRNRKREGALIVDIDTLIAAAGEPPPFDAEGEAMIAAVERRLFGDSLRSQWTEGDRCTVAGEGDEVFVLTDLDELGAMLIDADGLFCGRKGYGQMTFTLRGWTAEGVLNDGTAWRASWRERQRDDDYHGFNVIFDGPGERRTPVSLFVSSGEWLCTGVEAPGGWRADLTNGRVLDSVWQWFLEKIEDHYGERVRQNDAYERLRTVTGSATDPPRILEAMRRVYEHDPETLRALGWLAIGKVRRGALIRGYEASVAQRETAVAVREAALAKREALLRRQQALVDAGTVRQALQPVTFDELVGPPVSIRERSCTLGELAEGAMMGGSVSIGGITFPVKVVAHVGEHVRLTMEDGRELELVRSTACVVRSKEAPRG